MEMTPYRRLEALGLQLPPAPAPAANYVPFTLEHGFLFVAGQLPYGAGGAILHPGRLGDTVTLDEGRAAARQCGLNLLAQAHAALGDLGRIKRVMRVNGFVAVTQDFHDMPSVLDGASNLLYEVLGEAGRHSRVAVGVYSLPRNGCVEVDAVMAVHA
jgi:Putative translation initiation inhibitor, yjgF family